MGLDIGRDEVISCRDVALAHLPVLARGGWGAIAAAGERFQDCPLPVEDLLAPEAD